MKHRWLIAASSAHGGASLPAAATTDRRSVRTAADHRGAPPSHGAPPRHLDAAAAPRDRVAVADARPRCCSPSAPATR